MNEQPLSARVQKLRSEMQREKRYMSVEQARIIHRVALENPECSAVMLRAKMLKASFEEMPIRIDDGELIVGNRTPGVRSGVVFPQCGIAWLEQEIDTLPTRPQDPFLTTPEDVQYVKQTLLPYWKQRTLESRIAQELQGADERIASVVKINQKGRAQGHIIPDIPRWLRLGPAGLKSWISGLRLMAQDASARELYEAAELCLDGVLAFIQRYAALAEERAARGSAWARDYAQVAQTCRALCVRPAQSFREALQAVWFLMVCLQMESNAASISLGRLDQALFSYYARDVYAQELTQEDALELLECFYLKFNQIVCMRSGLEAKYFAGFPIGFNIVLGGRDEHGALLENELNFLMLRAQKALHLPQPNLSARRHRALRLAIERVEGMMLQNHALETLRLFKVLPRRSARGLSALHCNVLAPRLSSGFAPPATVGRIRWKEFTFLFHFHCFPATSARYNIPHIRLERGHAAWRSEFFL